MRTAHSIFPLSAILLALWSMAGCGPAPVAADAVDLDPMGWKATDTAVMEFRVGLDVFETSKLVLFD